MPNPARADLVAAVAAALATEAGRPATVRLASPSQDFMRDVRRQRVVGLLATQGAQIGLPDDVLADLKRLNTTITMRALPMASATQRVVGILADAGVESLVLKGVALSMQTTGSINARDSRDLDLLVAPSDVPRAHRALLAGGFTYKHVMYPGEHAAWRLGRWANREVDYRDDRVVLDLHWRLTEPHGLAPETSTLLGRASPVLIGGISVPTLSPDDALAATCAFAHIDYYRELRYLVDLHRLITRGAGVPADASPELRQLIADTIGFARELLPGWPRVSLPGLPDTRYAWKQWELGDTPPGRVGAYTRLFRHAWRYAPRVSGTAQVLTLSAIYPPDVDPAAGARGFISAIGRKVRRLPQAGTNLR